MTGKPVLFGAAVVFLLGAVFSGGAVSSRVRVDTFQHIEVFGSGFQRLKHFAASALFLQLDKYHHIEMYQGIPWTQVTDYLPQMWLIAKLDPHFTDVYTDAAFHLAVNLGRIEDGMDFIREGVRENPDSLDVRFQYAYLLWETGTGTPEEVIEEWLLYREVMRRQQGDNSQPYCEGSSTAMMAELLKTTRGIDDPYSVYYGRRRILIRTALREGVYYPGYLGEPPPFLRPAVTEEIQ